LLLNDVQSRVPVYVEGVYVEGILAGNSGGRPTLLFTNTDDLDAVPNGALVYSSGAGGVMPRGIPVGTVAERSDEGVLVDLKANYARTRIVRVVKFDFPTVVEEPAPERPLSPSERAAIEANPLLSATAEPPAPPADIETDGD
jgi:rod shape-determining protein MreC